MGAIHKIKEKNSLPGVCGRVCPAPCMEGCNRREYDGAVNIRGLERWIASQGTHPCSSHIWLSLAFQIRKYTSPSISRTYIRTRWLPGVG